jgi:predicted MFS family arabinose efflux permease
MAIGTLTAAYGLGAFTGPALGRVLVDATGSWQTPLVVYGAFGIVVLVAVLVGVPKSASEYGARTADSAEAAAMGVTASGSVFNRTVICAAIAAAGAGFALNAWLGLYPTYLRDELGFSASQASVTAGMFGIGALAALFGGYFADRMDQRLLNVIGLTGLMITGVLIFITAAPQGVQIAFTLLMGVFFTGVVYTNTSTLMQRNVAPTQVGRAQGVFLASLYIPASVSGYVFALAMEEWGWAIAGVLVTVIPCLLGLAGMAAMARHQMDSARQPA